MVFHNMALEEEEGRGKMGKGRWGWKERRIDGMKTLTSRHLQVGEANW